MRNRSFKHNLSKMIIKLLRKTKVEGRVTTILMNIFFKMLLAHIDRIKT